MITSIEQAFEILDTSTVGIPFDAIEFLYEHVGNEQIDKKILDVLTNAYHQTRWDVEDYTHLLNTPLWYAILAEKHHSEQLLKPIINLFTTKEDDWYLMNEQGLYLLEIHIKHYGNKLIPMIWKEIEHQIEIGSESPYHFLFDTLHNFNIVEYKDRFLKILERDFYYIECFVGNLVQFKLTEAIPIIQKHIVRLERKYKNDTFQSIELDELKEAHRLLVAQEVPFEYHNNNSFENRECWKQHYQARKGVFYENQNGDVFISSKAITNQKLLQDLFSNNINDNHSEFQTYYADEKIGRNDPCPCGSGKKYKKCCME